MKKSIISLVIAGSTIAASSAMAEVSANIGATSNYLWRGVSQSANAASISGGVDYAAESGFYAGTWVGSLGDSDSEFDGSEVDLYLGFGQELENFSWGVGGIYYYYPNVGDAPGEADINFGELNASIGFGLFSASINYTVTSDTDDPGLFVEGDLYLDAGLSFDLQNDWSIGFTLGHYAFDSDGEIGIGEADYTHLVVDFGKSTDYGDFTLSLAKADDDTAVADDDLNVVVSWSKGF